MNNVKEMKRLLKDGNGAIPNSSKTPSNEYTLGGAYNKSNQQYSLSNESQNAYRGGAPNMNYEDVRNHRDNYEDHDIIDNNRDTKIKKLISNDNNECSKNDLSSKN